MARITVEDCVEKVDNRFELVLLASHRARQISQGASLTVDRDNDKNPVVALREIGDGTLSPGDLKEAFIHSLQKHVEVDEPEQAADQAPAEQPAIEGQPVQAEDATPADVPEPSEEEPMTFDRMSEDELLAGIEGLVPPDKSNDEV